MKQFVLTITFVLVVISLFICSVFANKFKPSQQVKDGKFGIVYNTALTFDTRAAGGASATRRTKRGHCLLTLRRYSW
ncbi:TPA: hypothetical protein EYO57_07905 [Candidatus Poribacteria bacterium]|nr:hypothetical protein [Candidatus Poribacteria bacterium]